MDAPTTARDGEVDEMPDAENPNMVAEGEDKTTP